MGGAESRNKRAEEEREAASAKRRAIRKMESMEEQLALKQEILIRDIFLRAAEKREAASAKRREIRKMESMEEQFALKQEILIRDILLRAAEKGEDPPATRPETMEMKLNEEYMALMRQRAGSPAPSCLSLESGWSIGQPLNFSDEPGPSDTKAVEEREDPSATRPETMEMKLYEEYMALKQHLFLLGVCTSYIFPSPEKMGAASPAPSYVSMKSDRSMRLPVSFIRSKFSPEEEDAASPASSCVSMKSDRSMRNPLDFQR